MERLVSPWTLKCCQTYPEARPICSPDTVGGVGLPWDVFLGLDNLAGAAGAADFFLTIYHILLRSLCGPENVAAKRCTTWARTIIPSTVAHHQSVEYQNFSAEKLHQELQSCYIDVANIGAVVGPILGLPLEIMNDGLREIDAGMQFTTA